jgi:hypothetical protein
MRLLRGVSCVLVMSACGGATFKMAETPWTASDDTTVRLTRGADKVGCKAGAPDSTGEIEITCPEGAPDPESDAGSLRIGPGSDQRMLAMCNDGLAESCTAALEKMWAAGK